MGALPKVWVMDPVLKGHGDSRYLIDCIACHSLQRQLIFGYSQRIIVQRESNVQDMFLKHRLVSTASLGFPYTIDLCPDLRKGCSSRRLSLS